MVSISNEFFSLNSETIIAKPIADSAAATAKIKNTKTINKIVGLHCQNIVIYKQ